MDISQFRSDPRQQAYAALIRDSLSRPFEWGAHDCVTFAAAAIWALHGRNVLAAWTPVPWHTAHGAHGVLEALGGLRAAVTVQLGEPVPILQARLGDPALVADPENGRELLGVCHGEVILAPSAAGLAILPLSAAICAWVVQ